jgi:hypothetical protein
MLPKIRCRNLGADRGAGTHRQARSGFRFELRNFLCNTSSWVGRVEFQIKICKRKQIAASIAAAKSLLLLIRASAVSKYAFNCTSRVPACS